MGIKLVLELGCPVVCRNCSGKPDGIVIVRQEDFEQAIERAKRERAERRRALAMN